MHALFVSLLVLCICLVLLELGLRAIGYGAPDTRADPFFGFAGTNHLFRVEKSPDGTARYVPAPNKRFLDVSFAVHKPAGTWRIFALGGSTTEGQPYGNAASFPFRLGEELRRRHPERRFEVINLGIRGRGSSRVLQVLREVIHYDPDLIVVYTGQNEFRDAKFHPYELRRTEQEAALLQSALNIRVLFLTREIVMAVHAMLFGKQQISVGGETIARAVATPYSPDHFRSYDYFTVPELEITTTPHDGGEDAPRPAGRRQASAVTELKELIKRTFRVGWMIIPREEVYAIFRSNIAQMVETARQAKVPIVFVKKAKNPQERRVLKRVAYKVHSGDVDADRLERWNSHYRTAIDNLRNARFAAALPDLLAVAELSVVDQDRLLNLYLGRCYESSGSYDEAAALYESRIDDRHWRLNGIIEEVAARNAVPVIDAYRQLQDATPDGIVGYNYFVDAVHMTAEGYRVLGAALADLIEDTGYLPPGSGVQQAGAGEPESAGMHGMAYSAEVHTALGWSAFNQGDAGAAIRHATQALEVNPRETQAYLLQVYAYTRLGEPQLAEQAWQNLKRNYLNQE